ncbi:hypothetical protein [Flavobacterium sp. HTF]|uniref:hypothetical protein n=1 Tax=Flavobacterium sp. HTF TaxID=2170732 RepID=UPI001FB04A64|nr:hypothetical protein [Flavobacterium sp. HTF]
MNELKVKFFLFLFFLISFCHAQNDSIPMDKKDIRDVLYKIFKKNDSINYKNKKLAFSLLPVPVGVSSNTGLVVSFLTSFYLGDDYKKQKCHR